MGKKVSIAYYLNASAGAEGDAVIYTVPAAKSFKTEKITIHLESDSNFELELSIHVGIHQIGPTEGVYKADCGVISDVLDYELGSGERLILHYKNSNASVAKKALVLVSGTLE